MLRKVKYLAQSHTAIVSSRAGILAYVSYYSYSLCLTSRQANSECHSQVVATVRNHRILPFKFRQHRQIIRGSASALCYE